MKHSNSQEVFQWNQDINSKQHCHKQIGSSQAFQISQSNTLFYSQLFLNMSESTSPAQSLQNTQIERVQSSKIIDKQHEIKISVPDITQDIKKCQHQLSDINLSQKEKSIENHQDIQHFWEINELMDKQFIDFGDKYKRESKVLYLANRIHILSRDPQSRKDKCYRIKDSFRKSNFLRAFIRIYINQFFNPKMTNEQKIQKASILDQIIQLEVSIKENNSKIIPYFNTDKHLKIYLPAQEDNSIGKIFEEYFLLNAGKKKQKKVNQEQKKDSQEEYQQI